jgi:Tfp pilus assembly protein PilP
MTGMSYACSTVTKTEWDSVQRPIRRLWRCKVIRRGIISVYLLAVVPFYASGVNASQPGDQDRFQLRSVDATMTADEYEQAYRTNQHRILKFVESYSETTLTALGIPKKGVEVLGAVAGAAVTQNGTVYLNSGKSLAIDIKDAAQDDRAIIFAFKRKW